jgi:hypothetical protein
MLSSNRRGDHRCEISHHISSDGITDEVGVPVMGLSVTLVALAGNHLLITFLLKGHDKHMIVYAPPVQRIEGSTGLLFIEVYIAITATTPRHDVCSEADRPDHTIVRKQPAQTFLRCARGQISNHHLCCHRRF